MHSHFPLLVVDMYKPLKVNAVNAIKPECQNAGKNQSGIGIWTILNRVIPALAFRNQVVTDWSGIA
jgi:hypothetical protein